MSGVPPRKEEGRQPILRVVVVDDHPMTREGQRAVLSAEGDMQIVGEADTGEEALRLMRAAAPDLVVLDLNLAGKPNGIELCRRIKALPDAPYILLFTDYDLAEDAASRSSAETNGYLHKRSGSEELLDTIRRVAAGEKVWKARERVGEWGPVSHVALEDAHLIQEAGEDPQRSSPAIASSALLWSGTKNGTFRTMRTAPARERMSKECR